MGNFSDWSPMVLGQALNAILARLFDLPTISAP
jgi:hypothetical protein